MVILPISTFVFAQDSEEEEVEEVVVLDTNQVLRTLSISNEKMWV